MEFDTQDAPRADFYVNEHRVRFWPPDTVQIWWSGRCTRDEFQQVLDFGHACVGKRRHFVISDLSKLKSIDSDARKLAATDPRNELVAAAALIGTTFHVRVLMMMVMKAIELLNRKERGKFRFFDTEREAFDWITQERERLGLPLGESPKVQND